MQNKAARLGGFVLPEKRLFMKRFVSRGLINKGWSGDLKYCVVDESGCRYLLRVSSADRKERVEKTYNRMQKVAELTIPVCRSIEWGECDEGVYILQTWIDGDDAEKVIPALPEDRQYSYGLDAGRSLRAIHSILPTEGEHNWEEYFNRKIDRKLAGYVECPLKHPGGELMIDYIQANRGLLAGRPVTYQHGDFHIGNMMVDTAGNLVIIDFEKDDYGDPWEEFNRIVWCAQAAPTFARGIVDGYFNGQIPDKFWKLLALYIATNTLSSLPWAIPFGQEEIDVMLRQGRDVLSWYDGMKNVIPTWYRGK